VLERVLPLILGSLSLACFAVTVGRAADEPAKTPAPALNFTVKDIDGKPVDLAKTYQGKVLLVVNTASKCGLTPQYEELEAVYGKYKDKGFTVLAFPANEFGKQEPGSDSEIKTFCTSKYNVTFPVHSKIVVKGKGIHPLYEYLTSPKTDPNFSGEISWNFAKFLINRKGEVIARFDPRVTPDSPEVIKAIEAALADTN
jgi:glutathione peroxidase